MDVRVTVKLDMRVRMKEGLMALVKFLYERLPIFYFVCGLIRHKENFCK